jgi:uncharacterized RDD family membrane protein YckC
MNVRHEQILDIATAAPREAAMSGLGSHPAVEPAPLARRAAALLYDTLLIAGLFMGFTFLAVLARGMRAIAPETGWLPISLVAIGGCFYCWFWTHGGQTLGMRAWRIRLVRRDGGPVTWRGALARCAAAWLAALPAGLGYWWCLVDRERLCWHDRMSGTVPVRVTSITR